MSNRKFNGKGRVLIRANSETKINGITYNKDDIISSFNDVEVNLNYKLDVSSARTDKTELSYSEYHPNSLLIRNVMNDINLQTLLYNSEKEEYETEMFTIQKEKSLFSSGKVFFNITDKSLVKVETFSEGLKINPEINLEEGYAVLEKEYRNVEFFIFYKEKGTKLALEKPDFGYFRITVVVEGFLGDKEGSLLLNVPSANLVTDPSFELSDTGYGTDLMFVIVNNQEPEIRFYVN